MRNVTKTDINKVSIPEIALREDRGLKLCNEPYLVLADISDSSLPKNDYTLVFEKCDSLEVFTELNGVRTPAIGVAINIDDNTKGFVIEWRRYNDGQKLLVGCYKVVVKGVIEGVEFEYYQGAYKLLPYNVLNSEGTVQIYSIFNQYSEDRDIDFTGSGARETIRFRGFFGYRQPNYETLNNTHTDRIRNNVFRKTNNTYSLLCEPSFSCVTERIEGLHIKDGTLTYISDFNAHNHKEYREHPVILSEDQTPEFDYFEGIGTIYAKVLAQYKDRKSIRNAKFQSDGRNVGVPDIGLWIGVVGGASVKDASIQIVYQEADEQAIHTLITSNIFTITGIATTLNITNVEVNGAAVNVPFQLENGDLLEIDFDAAPSVGVINLTGNYV